MSNTTPTETTNPRVARARARAAVTASRKTGDILPRTIYESAGVDVPVEATDELQRNHDRERCTATVVTAIRRAFTPCHTATL